MASTSARLGTRRTADSAAFTRPNVWIIRAIDIRRELTFATEPASDLLLQLLTGRSFVRAGAEAEGAGETKGSEESSHPLRLKGGICIARK
jgi:hypothetical protein